MNFEKKELTLTEILFPNPEEAEKQEYKKYFTRPLWSVEEFGALMFGMTHQEFKKLEKSESELRNPKIFKKVLGASKLMTKFCKSLIKDKNIEGCCFFENSAYFSPWRFIQWVALNSISIRKRFAKELPLQLLEIYLFFQPGNIKTLAQGKNLRNFHHLLYINHAKEILEKHPNITREELYQRCIPVEIQFKNAHGERFKYKKRTLKYDWLKVVHKLPQGRPKKQRKKRTKK